MLHDLRFAVRQLMKSRGFALVAVLTMALGIGANTAIFSMVKAVFLRPLPGVRRGEDLAVVLGKTRAGSDMTFAYSDYRYVRERNTAFSQLAAAAIMYFSLSLEGRAERVWGEMVSGNYFQALGTQAALGRTLLPDDETKPGAHPVVVISDGLWRRMFGADRTVVGKVIRINTYPFTIVGVTPPEFRGSTVGLGLDVFLPLMMQPQLTPEWGNSIEAPNNHWLVVLGRRKPGVALEAAAAQMRVLGTELARENPNEEIVERALVVPLWRSPFGAQPFFLPVLSVLSAAVVFVLVIACANIAALVLARASGRRQEIAIRLALGAGRGQLVRLLLTESGLLALMGGAAGLLVSRWTAELINVPRGKVAFPIEMDVSADGLVFLFTLLVSIASGVLFGLMPALKSSNPDLVPALKNDAAASGHGRMRLQGALVVAQLAFSLPLLVSAGLMVRSFRNAQKADPGFDTRNVLLLSFDLKPNGYDQARGRVFYKQLVEQLGSMPGVESVSLANELPLHVIGSRSRHVEVPGYQPRRDEDSSFPYNFVAPDYFRALRIPLLTGREFTVNDNESGIAVAIVNETLARRFWPGQDAVGKTLETSGRRRQVVGVVRDVKYLRLTEPPVPYVYLPFLQEYQAEMTAHIRTRMSPAELLTAARRQVESLDSRLPILEAKTMAQQTAFSYSLYEFAATLLGSFGLLALALAALGLYGVISYRVGQRTHEIGVRMALGAARGDVLRLVLSQSARLVLVGAAIGLAGAVVTTRLLGTLLYGLSPRDSLTYAAVSLFQPAVAVLASWVPAHRASRVDPAIALRHE